MTDYLALINNFYRAFGEGDAETMAAYYQQEAVFTDPVFDLTGDAIGDMWRMLCAPGNDADIELKDASVSGGSGRALWTADYTFKPTGNRVHNEIEAAFEFENGLIITHTDSFDFARWSRQALGLTGRLFGHTSWLQNKVRTNASNQLERFSSRT